MVKIISENLNCSFEICEHEYTLIQTNFFFAVLESKYAKDLDEGGSREAIKDIHDYFVKDIIKKGYMGKKMDYLPAFREHYFVLQPQVRQIKKIYKKKLFTYRLDHQISHDLDPLIFSTSN